MFLNESHTPRGIGVLYAQDHNPVPALKSRNAIWFVRSVGRLDTPGALGHGIEDPLTRGDWLGLHNWPAIRDKRNGIPSGWSNAWPALTTASGGTIGTGTGCSIKGATGILPMFKDGQEDSRFIAYGLTSHYPVGTRGVMLAGTHENRQEDIFLHADNRLVAPDRQGAAALGTAVHDVDGSGGYGVFARLQTAWRVLQPQGGKGGYQSSVLAWQIGGASCGQDGWGFVWDRSLKTGAVMGRAHWGPLHVGDPKKDKHFVASTKDGENVNSGHLDPFRTYWFADTDRDGPIHFDDVPYQPESLPPEYVPAYLRWRGASAHRHFGDLKDGLWELQSRCFFRTPTTGCPIPTPGVGGGTPSGPPVGPDGLVPLPDLRDGPATSVLGKPVTINAPYDPSEGTLPMGMSSWPIGSTAFVGMPQAVVSTQPDLRRSIEPDRKTVCSFDQLTPVTWRAETFGDEGGLTLDADVVVGGGSTALAEVPMVQAGSFAMLSETSDLTLAGYDENRVMAAGGQTIGGGETITATVPFNTTINLVAFFTPSDVPGEEDWTGGSWSAVINVLTANDPGGGTLSFAAFTAKRVEADGDEVAGGQSVALTTGLPATISVGIHTGTGTATEGPGFGTINPAGRASTDRLRFIVTITHNGDGSGTDATIAIQIGTSIGRVVTTIDA